MSPHNRQNSMYSRILHCQHGILQFSLQMNQSFPMMMQNFLRWLPDTLLGNEASLRLSNRSFKDGKIIDN